MQIEMLKQDETVGAAPHVNRGEKVAFYDLWKAALISSDNNSVMAMIRALGIENGRFVKMMNDKAHVLGLVNTKFSDPTGLDAGNMSSAGDVARLLHYALKQNGIREMVLQPSYEFKILNKNKPRKIFNTDVLLSSFLNKKSYGYELIGGKTGYTIEAGYCLAVELSMAGREIIIVVLDGDSIDARFNDAKVLADWIFFNYKW
jgi:D-alanyl-D-alanine endopeptidase (penicillin-binding protein 7)